MLEFSDGEKFDTSGDYRVVSRRDGHYVVGRGMLVPVSSFEEGQDTIRAYRILDSLREQV